MRLREMLTTSSSDNIRGGSGNSKTKRIEPTKNAKMISALKILCLAIIKILSRLFYLDFEPK
jgi:hypothetical protein